MADDLDAWAGDQRAQAAADARARERWLRQQAADLIFPNQEFDVPPPPAG